MLTDRTRPPSSRCAGDGRPRQFREQFGGFGTEIEVVHRLPFLLATFHDP